MTPRWSQRRDRVRRRRQRGRGAARRAGLHQAVPAALQHPPARRQVLPVHRDLARRGLPARLLHARAPSPRPRLLRAVLERQARARARSRCSAEGLPDPLLHRRRAGPALAARPCLDYHIKRCAAPCVGYVSREEYRRGHRRRRSTSSAGRYGDDRARARAAHARGRGGAGVRAGGGRAQPPARRALAARAPARRERGGRHARRDRRRARRPATPTRRSSRCATACSPTASRSTSPTRPSAASAEVIEEFLLQYYETARRRCRRWSSSSADVDEQPALADALASRRGGPRRGARRRARREAADPRARRAQRALALEEDQLQRRAPARAPRRGARRAAQALGARRAADADRVLRHLEPRRHAHRRLDGRLRGRRAEEVRLPPLQDPLAARAPRRLRVDGRGARAALWATASARSTLSPHDPGYDASFATLPNVIVIDGGKGQLAAGLEPLRGFRERGVAVISLAKRLEEVFVPGRRDADRARPRDARAAAARSASATRRTASRSPTTARAATAR